MANIKYPLIVKVPGINSALADTHGCRDSGNAILSELKNCFSNETGRKIDVGKMNIEEIHVDNSNLQEAEQLIYKNSLNFFKHNPKVIFLGGDHSISYSTSRAFLDYCKMEGKKPILIVFDAHADCMDLWKENKTPDHEEWLSFLVKSGFPAEEIMIVGARKFHENEMKFLNENKIKQININSIEEDIDNIADTLMEFCYGKEVYISIDIDVLDPVFAPATFYAESGGLTSRQLIYILQRLSKVKTLRAMDLVEINSFKDLKCDNLTTKVGAKILSELL